VGQPELHWSERATPDPTPPCAYDPALAKQRVPRTASRSRRTPIIWAVVACLVVAAGVTAFLLINAKNAAAADQKAKAAALTQMGTYTDYATGVSFPVPIAWEQIPLDNAINKISGIADLGSLPSAFVAFGQGSPVTGGSGPGALMMFAAQDYPGGVANMSVKETLEQSLDLMKEYAPPGVSFEGGVREIKGATLRGAEMTMRVAEGGETALMRMCFLDAGDCFYMFIFAADENTWEQSQYFFDGTVESLSLLGT
jgi:hypothetical protein